MLQPITQDSAHNLPKADKEGFVLPNISDWKFSGDEGLYDGGYAAPELRQAFMKFIDPLSLNFKLLVNVNATTGLFAGSDVLLKKGVTYNENDYPVNSALAYLLRIGERERYILLCNWLFKFIDLVKNYDFLIQDVEGLDAVINPKPWDAFTDETITVKFRETSDQRVESLLILYREIWYDSELNNVVIPTNLNRIDVSVLVYQSGYFLSELFDLPEKVTIDTGFGYADIDLDSYLQLNPQMRENYKDRYMFPTRKKMSRLDSIRALPEGKTYPFIYHNFRFKNALINVETGSDFFGTISNNPGNTDMVTTSLKWNFWGCDYTNCFHGDWGDHPTKELMVYLSKINEINKIIELNERFGYPLNVDSTYLDQLLNSLPKNFLGNFKDSMKSSITDILNTAKSKVNKYINQTVKKINTGYRNLNNYIPNIIHNFGVGLIDEWDSKLSGTEMPQKTDNNVKLFSDVDYNIERETMNSAEYREPVGTNIISQRNKAKGF